MFFLVQVIQQTLYKETALRFVSSLVSLGESFVLAAFARLRHVLPSKSSEERCSHGCSAAVPLDALFVLLFTVGLSGDGSSFFGLPICLDMPLHKAFQVDFFKFETKL